MKSINVLLVSMSGTDNVLKVDHLAFTCSATDARTHTSTRYSSKLRALCLSILVIICLLASLLVAVGNAHLSLG